MAARVTVRARIHAQHAQQFHIETGLLAHLAHGGMFHLLAVVHEASRQGKAVRLVDTFDDHHAPFGIIDDHIRGGRGIQILDDAVTASGTGEFFLHGCLQWRMVRQQHAGRKLHVGQDFGAPKMRLPRRVAVRLRPGAA